MMYRPQVMITDVVNPKIANLVQNTKNGHAHANGCSNERVNFTFRCGLVECQYKVPLLSSIASLQR